MKRLLSLKKLLVMLTFLLCGFCQAENAQAEPTIVRVSDLGVERFVEKCNYVRSLTRESEHISLDGISESDNLYDYWIGDIKGSNVAIVFYVNKEGYVSTLGIVSAKNYASSYLAGRVLGDCLVTIGLTENEYRNLSKQLEVSDKATVWGSNINRYVFVHEKYENDDITIYIGGYK